MDQQRVAGQLAPCIGGDFGRRAGIAVDANVGKGSVVGLGAVGQLTQGQLAQGNGLGR